MATFGVWLPALRCSEDIQFISGGLRNLPQCDEDAAVCAPRGHGLLIFRLPIA